MTESQKAFLEGTKSFAQVLPAIIPFGLIVGYSAVNAGVPLTGSVLMSFVCYAGAAQLAALSLMAHHAPALAVILTGLVINARFAMYSASLAPHLRGLTAPRRALYAYMLSDQAFAVHAARYSGPATDDPAEDLRRKWYYFGAAFSMWATYCVVSVIGVFVGALVPKSWSLDFAVPLAFMALLFPVLRDRPALIAAGASGAVALAARALPYNLGLLLAAFCGIGAGVLAEIRSKR